MDPLAESEPLVLERTDLPGANRSTHAPKLEKDALASVLVVAPIVIAEGALAGLTVHASALLFMTATAAGIPAADARATASAIAE